MSAQPNVHRSGPYEGMPAGSAEARMEDRSIGSLLRQLAHEVPALMTNELALAKAEMRESLRATRAGVAAVATGGVIALGGFLILLLAAVYGLSTVVAPWLAALIVGAAALVVGLLMVQAGKKKFEPESFRPERTLDALHKDRDAIARRTP
ncbi:phage holin family protein [Coralloluteibacterium thermophilus]|uniref:Phage holin family protein n=1 Tax=Coralloluteibacterium thermophilum TaxID=2707049 RepID=A0ABV9NJT6_9GAMM